MQVEGSGYSLCLALMGPQLEPVSCSGLPVRKRGQQSGLRLVEATKTVRVLEHMVHEEKLRRLCLFGLGRRRLKVRIWQCAFLPEGGLRESRGRLFLEVRGARTSSSGDVTVRRILSGDEAINFL